MWRKTNPAIEEDRRKSLVKDLMDARRAVGSAKRSDDRDAEKAARAEVHAAKVALGERGPVWWDDDAPDETRTLARNSSYASWWSEHGEAVSGESPED